MDGAALTLQFVTYHTAKAAVLRWHYSRCMPAGRNVALGVWEGRVFIGVILFGMGSGNATNGSQYGLARSHEMAELTRIALTTHRSPVSRIVAIALKLLKRQSPGIRLVISMADPDVGHHGGIYQAGNWIYTGTTAPHVQNFIDGRWVHHRTATARGSTRGLPTRPTAPKHRYLMPLDPAMRQHILRLKKPYPRVPSIASDAACVQHAENGATPIGTLITQRHTEVST